MSLADLFRPRWRHSNPVIRAQGVQSIEVWTSSGCAILANLASSDPDLDVRLAALGCLPPQHPMLRQLASMDPSPAIRQAAIETLGSWPGELPQLAKTSPNRDTRFRALDHIPGALARADWPALETTYGKDVEHARYLFDIAESAQDSEIRAAALNRLADLPRRPRIGGPDLPDPPATYAVHQLLDKLAMGTTVDSAETAFATVLPHLGCTSLVDFAHHAKLPEIRDRAGQLLPDCIRRLLGQMPVVDHAEVISRRGPVLAAELIDLTAVTDHILGKVPESWGTTWGISDSHYDDGRVWVRTTFGPYETTFDYYRTAESRWICYEDHVDYS